MQELCETLGIRDGKNAIKNSGHLLSKFQKRWALINERDEISVDDIVEEDMLCYIGTHYEKPDRAD